MPIITQPTRFAKLMLAAGEKIFRMFRETVEKHPRIHFVAVSHNGQSATGKWLQDVGGNGNVEVEVVVDHDRQSFSRYGLGPSVFWAVLHPWSLPSATTIGKKEGHQYPADRVRESMANSRSFFH